MAVTQRGRGIKNVPVLLGSSTLIDSSTKQHKQTMQALTIHAPTIK
jgi:hypothetical protein